MNQEQHDDYETSTMLPPSEEHDSSSSGRNGNKTVHFDETKNRSRYLSSDDGSQKLYCSYRRIGLIISIICIAVLVWSFKSNMSDTKSMKVHDPSKVDETITKNEPIVTPDDEEDDEEDEDESKEPAPY